MAASRGKREGQRGPSLVVLNVIVSLGSTRVADVLSLEINWREERISVDELDVLGLLALDDVVSREGAVVRRNDDQVGIGACDALVTSGATLTSMAHSVASGCKVAVARLVLSLPSAL